MMAESTLRTAALKSLFDLSSVLIRASLNKGFRHDGIDNRDGVKIFIENCPRPGIRISAL